MEPIPKIWVHHKQPSFYLFPKQLKKKLRKNASWPIYIFVQKKYFVAQYPTFFILVEKFNVSEFTA